METINPSTSSGQVNNIPEANKEQMTQGKNLEPKPKTLVGMVANLFHHLTLRETAAFIRHRPLVGVAFIFMFILIMLSIAVSIRRRPQSYFTNISPTPTPALATPPPILSQVGKTPEFQALEATLSGILQDIKNVDLSESKLGSPLLETNLTFEN